MFKSNMFKSEAWREGSFRVRGACMKAAIIGMSEEIRRGEGFCFLSGLRSFISFSSLHSLSCFVLFPSAFDHDRLSVIKVFFERCYHIRKQKTSSHN